VHTVAPFPQIAVDVQSCQIGNFCLDFRIRKPQSLELHLDFRIILDFSYLP
jgi:hypothetical protein